MENGIPINFLTKEEAKISLDPVIWDSRCRIHKPKNPNDNVLKAMKFLKKLPSSDLYKFSPIIVYDKTSFKNYPLTLETLAALSK